MSGFSAAWLDLREPADAAARSEILAQMLAARFDDGARLDAVDLGCGTGAGLRWLSPRLRCVQHWRLLDHDPALLQALPTRLEAWAAGRALDAAPVPGGLDVGGDGGGRGGADEDGSGGPGLQVRWQRADLVDALPALDGVHLVSAAALADLVSRAWVEILAARCARAGAAALLSLCYDGRLTFSPGHPLDAAVRDAVNRHQLRDKGFGPALGPGAPAAAAAAFLARGCRVVQGRSDWRLGPEQEPLALALIDGWADAVSELAAGERPGLDAPSLEHWRRFRAARAPDPRACIRVGHADVLALPPR